MRPLALVIVVVVCISAISGTIWLGRYSPYADKTERPKMRWEYGTAEAQAEMAKQSPKAAKAVEEHKNEIAALEEKKPPIAKQAPFPKAHDTGHVYDFGSMGVNEEKKHKFTIENKGQG